MVADTVQSPLLKGITIRYLLAYAEENELYGRLISSIHERLPEYDEARILDTKSWIPQKDFKQILRCFKEISGLWNPRNYNILGRAIPTTGDMVPYYASMLAGPEAIIKISQRINHSFNTDQEIMIESIKHERDKMLMRFVTATVQHYMLPSTETPYLEMVTAALGYWEGVPQLWGWPETGETRFNEVQLTLAELVERDFAYLSLKYSEKGRDVLFNDKKVGEFVDVTGLGDFKMKFGYEPREEFLAKPLKEFRPVKIVEDVNISFDKKAGENTSRNPDTDEEIIFKKGELYGMPCNRYTVKIPEFSLLHRVSLFLKNISAIIGTKKSNEDDKKRKFLKMVSPEIAMGYAMDAQRREAEKAAEANRRLAEEYKRRAEESLAHAKDIEKLLQRFAHDVGNTLGTATTMSALLAERVSALEDKTDAKELKRIIPDFGDIKYRTQALHVLVERSTKVASATRILLDNDPKKIDNLSQPIDVKTIAEQFLKMNITVDNLIMANSAKNSALPFDCHILRGETHFEEGTYTMMLYEDLFTSALYNFYRNSNRAVSSNPNPLIYIKGRDLTDKIELVFGDNGIGMNDETRRAILERRSVVSGEGTGLGYFTIWRLVGHYKGALDIKSEKGKGCEVIIVLPKGNITPNSTDEYYV
ncbi:HAMP domain-containing histidine kinase [Candidatus Woesearchaeota archaeon]|nr:HAMP domain-containing histidine kinase [Candidatus Woesearchaeota archaeon]